MAGAQPFPSARLFCMTSIEMPLSIVPKKRGRPATGRDPVVAVRLPADLVVAVERATVARKIPRSQVIRDALAEYLKAKGYLK